MVPVKFFHPIHILYTLSPLWHQAQGNFPMPITLNFSLSENFLSNTKFRTWNPHFGEI